MQLTVNYYKNSHKIHTCWQSCDTDIDTEQKHHHVMLLSQLQPQNMPPDKLCSPSASVLILPVAGWSISHLDHVLVQITTRAQLLLRQPCNVACATSCQWTIHCVQEKETKMFFVISPTKFRQFWWNLVHCFLNKFAWKWCRRFPLNMNNVSTLPCKTWNSHCASKFATFESRWLPYSVWGLLQEKVYKTCVTDLDELKQRLRTEWAN